MFAGRTFLAVVPARGGSKGIPGKNLRDLGGRPLIEHTIAAALGSSHLDAVYVTSDDPAILAVARAAGAAVIPRPAELAGDHARSIDVLLHAIEHSGRRYDAAVLLQPTSPLRTARHIDEAIEAYDAAGRPVVGVSPARDSPVLLRSFASDATVTPLLAAPSTVRRQDLPEYWRVNGSIYVNPVEGLTPATSLNDNPVGYRMDAAAGVDIDEPVDLAVAEWYLASAGVGHG